MGGEKLSKPVKEFDGGGGGLMLARYQMSAKLFYHSAEKWGRVEKKEPAWVKVKTALKAK